MVGRGYVQSEGTRGRRPRKTNVIHQNGARRGPEGSGGVRRGPEGGLGQIPKPTDGHGIWGFQVRGGDESPWLNVSTLKKVYITLKTRVNVNAILQTLINRVNVL